jgi:hypothetical protein
VQRLLTISGDFSRRAKQLRNRELRLLKIQEMEAADYLTKTLRNIWREECRLLSTLLNI